MATGEVKAQTLYKNPEAKRFDFLKTGVERTTAVVASIATGAKVYLFGSMARKLLGNKEGIERHAFSENSDADLWIELPSGLGDLDDRLRELIDKEVGKYIEVTMMIRPNKRPRNSDEITDLATFAAHSILSKIIANREMILLYQNGQFFIPWREDGFVPTIKE